VGVGPRSLWRENQVRKNNTVPKRGVFFHKITRPSQKRPYIAIKKTLRPYGKEVLSVETREEGAETVEPTEVAGGERKDFISR